MAFTLRQSAVVAVAIAAVVLPAHAQSRDVLKPSKPGWRAGDLAASEEISGIACVKIASGARRCIIAVDEGYSALLVTLDGNRIKQDDTIKLVPAVKHQELDAEGAAYDPETQSFYVIGSHGTKRHSCEENPSAYNLIRIPIDPKTGRPTFDYNENASVKSWVAPQIVAAKSLKPALQNSTELGSFVDKCLGTKPSRKKKPKAKFKEEQGINIEGLAILNSALYTGLRGPVRDGKAYLAVFDLKATFTQDQTAARVVPVKLGSGIGVRDLASVDKGLLILSGPEDDEPGNAAIHFFDPATTAAKILGRIPPSSSKAKPEALLLLGETATHYQVLVLSDGVDKGDPTEFLIDK